jgi:hypothetical protein
MRFLEKMRDVLIISLITSFFWLALYVSVLDSALGVK